MRSKKQGQQGSRFKSEQGREGRAQPTSVSSDMFLQVS